MEDAHFTVFIFSFCVHRTHSQKTLNDRKIAATTARRPSSACSYSFHASQTSVSKIKRINNCSSSRTSRFDSTLAPRA